MSGKCGSDSSNHFLVAQFVFALAQDIQENMEGEWNPSKDTANLLGKLVDCEIEPNQASLQSALLGNPEIRKEIARMIKLQEGVLQTAGSEIIDWMYS